MPRSDHSARPKDATVAQARTATHPAPPDPEGPVVDDPASSDHTESWDPVDDELRPDAVHRAQWSWHGRSSWGSRVVAAYPVTVIVLAFVLMTVTTISTRNTVDRLGSVSGTGGALLLSSQPSGDGGTGVLVAGQPADYRDLAFSRPSAADQPIQGSDSLAVPPYAGWEANGSAGANDGIASVTHGLLFVGVRRATPRFRGWFLTATSPTPDACAFQFSAASPPPVTSTRSGAIGELVMAVQTSDTTVTGDIDYVLVAEIVHRDGQRFLVAGYSLGHVSRATEHVLKRVPWSPGPLQVAIETNGESRLEVWVNGSLFLNDSHLSMGIVPPLEPYLEVQAKDTPYTVSFRNYSSVCGSGVTVTGLPDTSIVELAGRRAVARGGAAVIAEARSSVPLSGRLEVTLPGDAQAVRFAPHTYWPGDRFSFESGT